MLKLKPARLRDRIGLIVLLHLVLMVGIIIVFIEQTDANRHPAFYRMPVPEKVALIAKAFERTPPDTHDDLTRAFADATLKVILQQRLPAGRPDVATPETLARYRDALGGRPFRIETFGADGPVSLDDWPIVIRAPVRISVQLADGRAIGIEQMVVAPITRILNNSMLFVAAVAILDVIVILWLASQTTRPVQRLARAVREDRLDDMKPGGPREIVELAETFRQLRSRLRSLLDERTRMLAAIAHDYRTYLTRIDLRSEFIEDEEQRALAAKDVEEMRDLLSDTLTFARESAAAEMDLATCDIRAELKEIATDRGLRGEHVDVTPIARPLIVHASHVSFQRMLANLLDNAIRYGGGHASVRTRISGTIVHIIVEDEGPGVPETSLGRMLEPFERLEPSRARQTGGVGLGLSIVQALAHRYEGDLALENRVEGGFRAILTLRSAEALAPRA